MVEWFSFPSYLWLLTLLIPVTIVHYRRRQASSSVVPSTRVWKKTRETEGKRFWWTGFIEWGQWLIATMLVVLITFYVAGFQWKALGERAPRSLTVIVDNSTSMRRISPDGSTFLNRAITTGVNRIQRGEADVQWRVFALAPEPYVVEKGTESRGISRDVFSSVQTAPQESLQPADVRGMDWKELKSEEHNVVFVTDGQGIEASDLRELLSLDPSEFQVRYVGNPTENIGVTNGSLKLDRKEKSLQLSVTVSNFSGRKTSQKWQLYRGTTPVRNGTVSLGSGETETLSIQGTRKRTWKKNRRFRTTTFFSAQTTNTKQPRDQSWKSVLKSPGASHSNRLLTFVLGSDDAFSLDDAGYYILPYYRRFVVVSPSESVRTRIVKAVEASGMLHEFVLLDEIPDHLGPFEHFTDAIWVVDGTGKRARIERVLAELTPRGMVWFRSGSPEGTEEIVSRELDQIRMIPGSGFGAEVDTGELSVNRARIMNPGDSRNLPLMESKRGIIGVRKRGKDSTLIEFGFSLSDSNFPSLPAFPLMIRNVDQVFPRSREVPENWMANAGNSFPPLLRNRNRLLLTVPSGYKNRNSELQFRRRTDRKSRAVDPGFYGRKNQEPALAVNLFSREESKMNRSISDREHWNGGVQGQVLDGLRSWKMVLLWLSLGLVMLYWYRAE